MSYTKSNNSGPCLTSESEIVANRIFIIEDNQPVNLTNLFFSATYVSDTTYTKSEIDNLLVQFLKLMQPMFTQKVKLIFFSILKQTT